MNPDNSAFENFNPVNLETVLLSEVVDPNENLFKESLTDLDTSISLLKRYLIILKILLVKIFLSYISIFEV